MSARTEKLKVAGATVYELTDDGRQNRLWATVQSVGRTEIGEASRAECEAMAHLFAAAPDLLAALKDVVKYAREDRAQTPGFTRLARALVRADAALASAEGRS